MEIWETNTTVVEGIAVPGWGGTPPKAGPSGKLCATLANAEEFRGASAAANRRIKRYFDHFEKDMPRTYDTVTLEEAKRLLAAGDAGGNLLTFARQRWRAHRQYQPCE